MFEAHPRQKGVKMCNLCNLEKTSIAIADPTTSLNKRSEILQRCRHRDKLVLANNLSRQRRKRLVNSSYEVLDPVTESEENALELANPVFQNPVVNEEVDQRGEQESSTPDVRRVRPLRKEQIDYSFY